LTKKSCHKDFSQETVLGLAIQTHWSEEAPDLGPKINRWQGAVHLILPAQICGLLDCFRGLAFQRLHSKFAWLPRAFRETQLMAIRDEAGDTNCSGLSPFIAVRRVFFNTMGGKRKFAALQREF